MTAFRASDSYRLPAWIVRLLIIAIAAVSILLAVWSWRRQQVVARDLRTKTAQQTRLVTQVQQLEMRWDPAEAAKVDLSYQQTVTMLFSGPEELANWQTEVQRQTRLNLFDNSSKLGKPETRTSGDYKLSVVPATINYKLSVVPATLDLEANGEQRPPKTSYHGLLAFARSLQELPKRFDLTELSVTAGTNSIAQARVVLQLWSRGGTP